MREANQVILFGAGRAARDIVEILREKNINIDAVAVNNVDVTTKMLCGYEVKAITNLLHFKETATIIIGVTSKYAKDVERQLEELGFKNLMKIDNY